MEIKINISAPGLEKAILTLAEAIDQKGNRETQKALVQGGWAPGGGEVEVAQPVTQPEVSVVNIAQPAPVTQPVAQPVAQPAPVAPVQTISLETVRAKFIELAQAGKQQQVKALLTTFGVEKLPNIPPERYAELLEKASEL